jgi:uncharacterized protein
MIDPTQLSPWLLLLVPLVIVVAYTVFGLSGFGSTAIAVPILAHFFPVSYLVPLMALLDCASSIFVGTTGREHLAKSELKRLIPIMFVGFVLGTTALVRVPDHYLRLALGLFAVTVGVHGIVNPVLRRIISPWWVVPVGLIGGVAATVFGAGGPIYATYLSGRLRDKSAVRTTVSTLISVSTIVRAAFYAVTGLLLHVAIAGGVVLLAPFVWTGLKLGTRIHLGLTQEQMRRAIGALLVLIGGSLLLRVAFGG